MRAPCGRARHRRWPCTSASPEVGVSRPRISRASVDLPQPDSPTMPSTLPCGHGERHAVDRDHMARLARTCRPLTLKLLAQVANLDGGLRRSRAGELLARVRRQPAEIGVAGRGASGSGSAPAQAVVGERAARAEGAAGKADGEICGTMPGMLPSGLSRCDLPGTGMQDEQPARVGMLGRGEQLPRPSRARPLRRHT